MHALRTIGGGAICRTNCNCRTTLPSILILSSQLNAVAVASCIVEDNYELLRQQGPTEVVLPRGKGY